MRKCKHYLVHPGVNKPIVTQHAELVEACGIAQVSRLESHPSTARLSSPKSSSGCQSVFGQLWAYLGQRVLVPDGPPVETFTLDDTFYSHDEAFPVTPAEVRLNGRRRGQPVAQVQLVPFQYNPGQETLVVYWRLRAGCVSPLLSAPRSRRSQPGPTRPMSACWSDYGSSGESVWLAP